MPRVIIMIGSGLAVVAWIKLGTMLGFGLVTSTTWSLQDFDLNEQSSRLQLIENSIEPHKAHYNLGTSLAAQGELAGAEAALVAALALSTPGDECAVRLNLSLVLEAQAQENEPPQQTELLARSRSVIEGARATCRNGPLAAIDQRMQVGGEAAGQKDVAGDGKAGDQTGVPQAAPDESNPALDEISDRMMAGSGREYEEQQRRSQRPKSGSIDKPW